MAIYEFERIVTVFFLGFALLPLAIIWLMPVRGPFAPNVFRKHFH